MIAIITVSYSNLDIKWAVTQSTMTRSETAVTHLDQYCVGSRRWFLNDERVSGLFERKALQHERPGRPKLFLPPPQSHSHQQHTEEHWETHQTLIYLCRAGRIKTLMENSYRSATYSGCKTQNRGIIWKKMSESLL